MWKRDIEQYSSEALYDVVQPDEDLVAVLPAAVDWIAAALQAGGTVLVNCFVGTSRSAAVIIAFLLRHR